MADGSNKFKNSINLKPQSGDPSNPAEGDIFRSDGTSRTKGIWEYKDGAWVEVGSGSGSGGINYLEGDNNSFESSVGDWVAYADAAGTEPVDGTGGSPTITIAKSTDTSLRGDSNGLITKDAANRQGEGASCAFTIDEADKAKKLTISFDYTTSANYADDDIKIFVYDVTNANLIRVNGEDLKAISGQSTHYAQFQTASDSTSYRLIIHQSTDDATAYTVRIDNVKVGPTNLAKGAIITDWKESNLTFADVLKGETTDPTIATSPDLNKIWYRRVGDEVQIKGKYRHTSNTGAAAGSGSYYFDFSFFGAIDLNKFARLANRTSQHFFSVRDTTGAYDGQLNDATKTDASFFLNTTNTQTDARLANVGSSVRPITATDYTLSFYVAYPVQGWSSEAVMSEDLGGREIRVEGSGNGGTSITANDTNIDFTETVDTTASFDGTTFTAPESGTYIISGVVLTTTAVTLDINILKNGSALRAVGRTSSSDDVHTFTEIISLEKDDYISFQSTTSMTLNNAGTHHIHIQKLASPQTILETETVAAHYRAISGQSIDASTYEVVVFDDVIYDTHNAMNTTTGIYTVPVSGKYLVSGLITYSDASLLDTDDVRVEVYLGAAAQTQWLGEPTRGATSSFNIPLAIVDCNKGEELSIRTFHNSAGARTLTTTATRNVVSIARIK